MAQPRTCLQSFKSEDNEQQSSAGGVAGGERDTGPEIHNKLAPSRLQLSSAQRSRSPVMGCQKELRAPFVKTQ